MQFVLYNGHKNGTSNNTTANAGGMGMCCEKKTLIG